VEIKKQQRILAFDGVRGLAALLVLYVHFHNLFVEKFILPGVALTISRTMAIVGYETVGAFFLISGFLIYGALMRKHVSYITYIGHRIRRIYPTFGVVFLLYLVLSEFFPAASKLKDHGNVITYLLANIFMLPGMVNIEPIVAVAWSLSYEWFFIFRCRS